MCECRILYIHPDRAAHAILQHLLMGHSGLSLEHFTTGKVALQHLGTRLAADMPNLIITPFFLPTMSAADFAVQMKADPRTRPIPIIAMGSDSTDEEITALYGAGVSCVIKTASDYNSLASAIVAMRDFWTHHVALPFCTSIPVAKSQPK